MCSTISWVLLFVELSARLTFSTEAIIQGFHTNFKEWVALVVGCDVQRAIRLDDASGSTFNDR